MKKIIILPLVILFLIVSFETAFNQSKGEVRKLVEQGKQALQHGMYLEAIGHFEKAIEICKENDKPKCVAWNLHRIGKAYFALNQFDKALENHEKALEIFKEIDLPKGRASTLDDIGSIYHVRSQYNEALDYHKKALEIYKEIDFPRGRAKNLGKIGGAYHALGQFNEALKYYEESLRISTEINDKMGTARTLNNIGNIHLAFGRYIKALNYFKDALEISKEINQPTRIAKSLGNIGVAYQLRGQYDEAIKHYKKSLNIFRELNQPSLISRELQHIGNVYFAHGRYDQALEYFEEALKTYRKQNQPFNIGKLLNNIGRVNMSMGRYDQSLEYYKEALKIFREINKKSHIPRSLQNMGDVYLALGQHNEALNYYGESLEIFRELNQPKRIAKNLKKIGWVYFHLKDYQKAEVFFEKAEREGKKKKAGRDFGRVYISNAKGQYEESLKFLEEMPPEWRDTDHYMIRYYTQRGLALKGIGKLSDASGDFLKVVSLIEEIRERIKGEKKGFFGVGERMRAYRTLVSTLSERVIKGEKEDSRFISYGKNLASAAFYFSESTKARTLLEAMSESERIKQRVAIPEDLRKKEESLFNQISAIDSKWEEIYEKGGEYLKEFKKRKEELTFELNSLIKELREKYPRYAALHYPKPFPPEDLPLRSNEVLLEYALGDEASYLFLVRKGGVERILKIPMGREALDAKVKAFMKPLNILSFKKFSVKKAKELYNILLSPALKDIKESDKIIIIPDGILGLLPFEALVMKEGKGVNDSIYVGDNYNMTYYQSATVLALQRLLKDVTAKKPFFALGNPIYNEKDRRYMAYKEGKSKPVRLAKNREEYAYRSLAASVDWGKTSRGDEKGKELMYLPLPETEDEVKAIAKLFNVEPKPPDVLLDVSANETSFWKSPLNEYRYIHFATHADSAGMVQGIQEPFILLGQVENKGKDDGFLSLTEVLGLNLDSDIVVLSACVTGRGKMIEGEGVANFARAFQHAGARSVLVSLWEVSSMEAVEYMKTFYAYLKAGKGKGEAMKLARGKIKSKNPNPFYWAVFILHGES